MKLLQIVNGYESLKKISALDLQSIAKNRELYILLKTVTDEFEYFKSEQIKIIKKHGTEQEDGTFKFDERNYFDYNEAIGELGNFDVDGFQNEKIAININLLEGVTASDMLSLEPLIEIVCEGYKNA